MKDKWTCPICQTVLVKNKDADGEGVKKCTTCGASWFLLLCRRPSAEWQEKEAQKESLDKLANLTEAVHGFGWQKPEGKT